MNSTTAEESSRTGAGGTIAAVTEAISNAPGSYKALALGALLVFLSRVLHGGSRKKRVTELPFWVPLEIVATAYFITAGGLMGRILYARRSTS